MKKTRNILFILGLAGLIVVIILNLHELNQFIHLLSSIRVFVLLIVVVVQLFSYYLNALYYRSILRIFNYRNVGLYRLFEGAMAANFVNYIVPSAGMAGAGFFSQVLYPEVPRGKGVLVQIMRYALSALGVLLMIPVGIGLLVITRPLSAKVDRIAISASLIILILAIVIVGLVNQETWLRQFVKWLESKLKKVFSRLKPGTVEKFVDDFYVGYHAMVSQKKTMLIPFGWSVIYILEEIFTVYLAFLAFGKLVNPGVVIMGYVLANIASTIGGTFFSVGVFELGMLGTFVALGEPFVLAFSVTLLYRVMNLIIGLPPGFLFYRRFLNRPD